MPRRRSRIDGMRMPFVVTVAMSAALTNCGGKVIGGEGESGSGGSSGAGGDDPGGTGGITGDGGSVATGGGGNPPYPGGYYPGSGGFGANPPGPPTEFCPAMEPTTGAWCNYIGPGCEYGDCYGSPTAYATCVNGAWQVSEASCNPPPYQCPLDEPPAGNACMPIGSACVYEFGGCYGEDGWYELHQRTLQCTVDGWQVSGEVLTECDYRDAGAADAGGD